MAKHTSTASMLAGASPLALRPPVDVALQVTQERPLEFKSTGGQDERDLLQLARDLKTALDQVKTAGEKSETEMKNLGKMTDETKANADKALSDMNGVSARLTEIEQKMSRRGGGDVAEFKSMGQRVVESDEFKSLLAEGASYRGRAKVEVKNITSASVAGTSATTALVVADRQPGIIQVQPNRKLVVRDLCAPGRTNAGFIEYVRETLYTNNAAFVAENPANPKPQSDLTFDLKNDPVRTLAHWVLASKQILADAPMLQSYIDNRLRYGLSYVEDLGLLLGDGTGANLLGMIPQATPFAIPQTGNPAANVGPANPTGIDKLRLAMLQAALALYPATGHVLNPTDWAAIELTRDTQGRYIFSQPQNETNPRMWGLPVVDTLAMPQGKFLTGAFRYACQIFDREDATVLVSTEDRDNFVKNMVTILAEERLGLAIYRPQALIYGGF